MIFIFLSFLCFTSMKVNPVLCSVKGKVMRMKFLYILVLHLFVFALCQVSCYAQNVSTVSIINFKPGDHVLYDNYKDNRVQLIKTQQEVSLYEDVILTGNGHIRLIASLPKADRNNPQAINLAATRASTVRSYLRQRYRMLTKWCFTFYIETKEVADNTVKVEYIAAPIADNAPTDIYYSTSVNDLRAIHAKLARYGKIPYLELATVKPDNPLLTKRTDSIATNPVKVKPIADKLNPAEFLVAIYYRWDKHKLDSMYLSNPRQLATLDSILTSSTIQKMDTLTIVAFASPEGHPNYNQRLSERRANTIRDYIVARYPQIPPQRIVTIARGENWEGLLKFALNDPELPSRDKVLDIITSGMSDLQKQSSLTKLDNGKTYYRYILPNYYRYLRNGASVFISYQPEPLPLLAPPLLGFTPPATIQPLALPSKPKRYFPIALRTNLLYDAIGAFNIGIEVPLGKRKNWSWIGDMAYSYWRSPRNLYALQTLEYGTELRYWLGVSEKKKEKNSNWAKPLKGWNVGLYGRYWKRYDAQWVNGLQGDGSWSAGLTAGYAFPISKQLAFEASLGAGWFSTSQYRHYHQPEYDKEGKYHLMWQETGQWSGLSITKIRLSLVWLIEYKKGGVRL